MNGTSKSVNATKKSISKYFKRLKGIIMFLKDASNSKIINRIKNVRTNINGNDIYQTIKSDNLTKLNNSNLSLTI